MQGSRQRHGVFVALNSIESATCVGTHGIPKSIRSFDKKYYSFSKFLTINVPVPRRKNVLEVVERIRLQNAINSQMWGN